MLRDPELQAVLLLLEASETEGAEARETEGQYNEGQRVVGHQLAVAVEEAFHSVDDEILVPLTS